MPNDFVKVAKVSDVKPGRLKGIWHENESVLLANVVGRIFAIGNICTHAGCTLSGGDLNGMNVTCPCHGSKFDLATGKPTNPPATRPETVYEVKVEGEYVLIKKK